MAEELRIEIAVCSPDEETRRHCREIVDEMKSRYQHGFMTIGAEISGEGPT